MAASHISGPSIVYGDAGAGSTAGRNPEAGPSVTYQGDTIADVRFPYQPGVTGRGVVKGLLDSPYVASVDAVPSTNGTALIAAAQAATSGTALTLASANGSGIGVNFPIVPAGSGYSAANVVNMLVLDPGFSACSTVSASTAVTLTNANYYLYSQHFLPGMTLLVSGGASNAWIACRVLSASVGATYTTVTVDTAMGATVGSNGAGATVALANGQLRLEQAPIAATAYLTAGAAAVFDPRSGLARGVSVTTAGANTGGQVTVSGYDVFGYPMSEVIACATASTFYGNKCFKYITSAIPSKSGGGALTGNVSVGTSDLFGFNTRSDAWEYTNVLWAGAWMTSSTGWYAADTTSPATSSTKDVRGAVQASAIGPNGSGIGANASNGSRRLQMFMSIPLDNLFAATPSSPASLFGTTQA